MSAVVEFLILETFSLMYNYILLSESKVTKIVILR